jgi:hypothetical protein
MYDVRDLPSPPRTEAATAAEAPQPAERAAPTPAPAPRWAGYALLACGVALVPWLVVLAVTLPADTSGAHWVVAWVGLDSMEAAGLITTGFLAMRRHRALPVVASAAAMLLVTDAWFDTTTAAPGGDFAIALAMALAAELPLAAACAVLAVRTLSGPPAAPSPNAGRAG